MVPQLIVSALLISAVYAFIATGIVLLFKTASIRSFCQGEVLMISAFFATVVQVDWGLPYIVTLIATLAVGVGIGILMEVVVFKPIRARVANHTLACLIATLGLSVFFRNLAYFVFGYAPKSMPSPFGEGTISIFGIQVTYESAILVIFAIVALGALQIFLNKTPLGKAMLATASNRDLANLIGIETNKTVFITCGLSGAFAAIAALMMGPLYMVSNDMGSTIGLKAYMAAVIGGFGNPVGALIGSVIVGFIEIFGGTYISSSYKDIIIPFTPFRAFIYRTIRRVKSADVNYANTDMEHPPVGHFSRYRNSATGLLWGHVHDDDIIDVAAGAFTPEDAKMLALQYLSKIPDVGEEIGGAVETFCTPFTPDAIVASGFLVVGHAAAQVNPTNGCGVAQVWMGALLAAQVIKRAEKFDINTLWEYAYRWMSGIGAHYAALFFRLGNLSEEELSFLLEEDILNGETRTNDYSGYYIPADTNVERRLEDAYEKNPELIERYIKAETMCQRVLAHFQAYPAVWNPYQFMKWRSSTPN